MLVLGIGRYSVLTGRCQDTSDVRHFGTGAEVSVRHFGTGAEVSGSVFGVVCAIVCCDITIASRIGLAWRLCTRQNRFNAVYLKHDVTDRTAIDLAEGTASASHSRSVAAAAF